MKRIIVILAFLILNTFPFVYAHGQSESLTITTYYPSPNGNYKSLTFLPNLAFNPGDPCSQAGETSYQQSAHALYICKGSPLTWKKLGSGSSSGKRVLSDHHVSPDKCYGSVSGGLCEDDAWYKNILFSPPFTKTPEVIVVMEHGSNQTYSPCTNGRSDFIAAFPQPGSITKSGFTLWAAGSPARVADCGDSYDGWRSRAEVGWMAIGE
jgi:hypothetical protein